MPSTIIPPSRSGGLVDGDRMAGETKLVRGGEPGGPAADDADRAERWPAAPAPWASCHTVLAAKLSTPNAR